MKLLGALLTLALALMIEAVAGYFSVIGLAALFAAAFWPVVIMGGTLEAGKLVAASWLKSNLKNPNVGGLHKLYLLVAILSLMAITSLGIYGYLAKAHLEQEANLPAIEMKIKQSEARIAQADAERVRQEARLAQLDQSVSVMLANSKTAKDARGANLARDAQRRDRLDIQKQITALNKEVNTLNDALVPLRLQVSDVSAKLGPVKYVANLFGWHDPASAVQLIIGLIMVAFDPLAVVMVLSGTMSLAEALREMAERREKRRAAKALTPVAEPVYPAEFTTPTAAQAQGRGTKLTELPEGENLVGDLDWFAKKPATSSPIPPFYFNLADDADAVAQKAADARAADELLRMAGIAASLPEAPPAPVEPVPVFMFDPSESATQAEPEAPVIVTQSVEIEQLQRAHEENAKLAHQLEEQKATFDALQAEIARLKAKEKLTAEAKPEMVVQPELPSFNSFSDAYIQPNK